MEPYGTLPKGKMRQKTLSYSNLEPYGTIGNHMKPYGTLTRGEKKPKKLCYSDLETYGTI